MTESAPMVVEFWPVDKVVPYARNPRIAPAEAVAKVAASLKEFGWRQPIVVDAEGVIIAGHTRLLAAQRLGLERVPVHIATDLSDAQVKAYRLADNRVAQETTWDYEMLNIELEDLSGLDIDLALTGFDPDELAGLGDGVGHGEPPAATDTEYREYTFQLLEDEWLYVDAVIQAAVDAGMGDSDRNPYDRSVALHAICREWSASRGGVV